MLQNAAPWRQTPRKNGAEMPPFLQLTCLQETHLSQVEKRRLNKSPGKLFGVSFKVSVMLTNGSRLPGHLHHRRSAKRRWRGVRSPEGRACRREKSLRE